MCLTCRIVNRSFDRDQRVSGLRLKVGLCIAVFFLRQDTLRDIVSLHPGVKRTARCEPQEVLILNTKDWNQLLL